MSGLNLHPGEENQPQNDIINELHEQARIRAEIERQIEAEHAQTRQQQQARATQRTASFGQTRENVQQRHVPQSQVRKRAFGFDAVMLCAVTLGFGAFFGPMFHSSPPMYVPPPTEHNVPFIPPGTDIPLAGIDEAGTNWSGSNAEIDKGVTLADGTQEVTGHFDWQENGQYAGREDFSGSYDPATGEMHVQGGDIQQVDLGNGSRLVDGDYNLQIGQDGKSIVSGHMQQIPGGSPAVPGDLTPGTP